MFYGIIKAKKLSLMIDVIHTQMKRKLRINAFLLITIFFAEIIFLASCRKEPVPPTLTTVAVTGITTTTATTGGNITSDGGAEITARGVCWSTTSGPLATASHTSDNKGSGSFSSNISGLTPGTTYYVRAYATNKAGTSYGNEISFNTPPIVVPVLTTIEVTGKTSTTAVSGGNITSDGGAPITAKGVCWSTAVNPTINDKTTSNGTGSESYASDLTGLQPGTTYHVRAYARNISGTGYGNDLTFVTLAVRPTVTTAVISNKTRTTAVSGGNVTSDGGSPVTYRGVCWSTSPGPVATGPHTTDNSGTGTFVSNITGLNPNTTYYVKAYATNSIGTSYGSELSFVTDPVAVPVLTTNSISGQTTNSAVSGGNITSDNGGAITERGVCWNTTGNPTVSDPKISNGTGTGSYTVNITGLTAGTTYYVRAYANNSAGSGYGNQLSFTTFIADIEGNVYKTIQIGTQIWMAENLKTTTYRDGNPVPNVTDPLVWSALSVDAYCWYDNSESSYKNLYGALYNWFSVNKGTLCPTGWHVPTDEELKTLEIYLGMTQAQADSYSIVARGTDQGTKLKSTSGWYSGGNGTNSSGFNGLPGGYRYGQDGGFYDITKLSYWWSSTEYEYDTVTKATYRRINYDLSGVLREGTSKKGGKYIRCLKN